MTMPPTDSDASSDAGASNLCEDAVERYVAAYLACGYDLADPTSGTSEPECTDEAAEIAQCLANCAELVDCGDDENELLTNIAACANGDVCT